MAINFKQQKTIKKVSIKILGDIILLSFSLLSAFILRIGFPLDPEFTQFLIFLGIPIILFKIISFYSFGLYKRMWRYASLRDLKAIIEAATVGSLGAIFISYILQTIALPRTVFVIDWLLTIVLVGGVRFFNRSMSELRLFSKTPIGSKKVLIVGAGDTGQVLVKEMLKNKSLDYMPIGFLDDDLAKKGMRIHGVKVIGSTQKLEEVVNSIDKPDEVIVAIPSAPREVKKKIVFESEKAKVKCKIIPGVYEIIDGRVSLNQIRDVEIEDILGRDPVKMDVNKISKYLRNQPVLITGAGGSIGSELCRQINQIKPSLLIMVDHSESNLFDIEQELKLNPSASSLITIVADIKDSARMSSIFIKYQPAVVFHAAAYKHVPMMEKNPSAALENNFIGTRVITELALKFGVKKFVLISTDKAVNPLNIMGASKALAERVIQTMPEVSSTKFITVRFGNVLASRGSVVPIFKDQIARGGPVTVTHPKMKRYFMTIPESVQLIIQAGALGKGDEIFVLDMGEQIKIKDLAENMIRLSGFELEKDIKIEYTGIRPGEKLDEELFNDEEAELPTAYEKIFMVGNNNLDKLNLREELFELEDLIKHQNMKLVFKKLSELLPSFSRGKELRQKKLSTLI